MARSFKCDVCQKPIDEVKAKLFITPTMSRENYTAHADIGACCLPKINNEITFTRRVKGARKRAS